jgi:hypothetical protein
MSLRKLSVLIGVFILAASLFGMQEARLKTPAWREAASHPAPWKK